MIAGVVLVWLSVAVIGRPLRRRVADGTLAEDSADTRAQVGVAASPAVALQTRRDAIYGALADLDFDRSIGKVNDDDHATLRAQLMTEGVDVLRRLDETTNVESRVEALVAERRQAAAQSAPGTRQAALLGAMSVYCTGCGSALRANDRFCGKCGIPVAANCPHCGGVVGTGDAFCVRCGTTLVASAAA
jgi:hypothetical protein